MIGKLAQFFGGIAVDPVTVDEYAATIRRLVAHTRPAVSGLVLMTPFLAEPDRADPVRALTDRFAAEIRASAEEGGCILVDLQAAYDRCMAHRSAASLAPDRVHTTHTGHALIATEWLRAMGEA